MADKQSKERHHKRRITSVKIDDYKYKRKRFKKLPEFVKHKNYKAVANSLKRGTRTALKITNDTDAQCRQTNINGRKLRKCQSQTNLTVNLLVEKYG
jgi:hypothetical protein